MCKNNNWKGRCVMKRTLIFFVILTSSLLLVSPSISAIKYINQKEANKLIYLEKIRTIVYSQFRQTIKERFDTYLKEAKTTSDCVLIIMLRVLDFLILITSAFCPFGTIPNLLCILFAIVLMLENIPYMLVQFLKQLLGISSGKTGKGLLIYESRVFQG